MLVRLVTANATRLRLLQNQFQPNLQHACHRSSVYSTSGLRLIADSLLRTEFCGLRHTFSVALTVRLFLLFLNDIFPKRCPMSTYPILVSRKDLPGSEKLWKSCTSAQSSRLVSCLSPLSHWIVILPIVDTIRHFVVMFVVLQFLRRKLLPSNIRNTPDF